MFVFVVVVFLVGSGGFALTSRSTIVLSCWDGAIASWVFTSTLGSSGVG